ncbi:MAG: sulfotransferase domain-containing protein [Ekhidna sp.]|uniref:sulfotransferase domain-containing protein n=1 Tax=Ekhidna sp. TaxID=2608089 RepID=UPI0032F05AB6
MDEKRIIWVIGFPKSGNTWLSYLIAYISNLPYHDFADLAIRPKKKIVRDLVSGQLNHPKISGFDFVYKSHKTLRVLPVKEQDFVIYIYRDPRDLYISYRHFMKNKFSGWKGRMVWRFHALFGSRHLIKWLFKRQYSHIKHWNPRADFLLSYEDLQLNSYKLLLNIFNRIGPIEDETIHAGVKAFSFKSLSEGRDQGKEDKGSFYRKGIVGDWEKSLTEREIDLYKSMNVNHLIDNIKKKEC